MQHALEVTEAENRLHTTTKPMLVGTLAPV